ncbi:MAG: hypothetical protein IIT93_00210 [Paludibacteraceae bacterium]|nr:hypothetical protein [Paludibacteraceae bacterium]
MAKEVAMSPNLIETFSEFKNLKNIDQSTLISVLEESFRSVIAKMFGTDENFTVVINPSKGDLEIWRDREVVEDGTVENEQTQVGLTDARKIDASMSVRVSEYGLTNARYFAYVFVLMQAIIVGLLLYKNGEKLTF